MAEGESFCPFEYFQITTPVYSGDYRIGTIFIINNNIAYAFF